MGTGQNHVRPSISQQTSVTVATQASQYQAVYFTRGPLRQDTSLWQHTHQYFLFSNGNPSWHCNCSCSRNASSFQDLFYWGASQWWVDKFIWSKRDVSTVRAMGITALNAFLLYINFNHHIAWKLHKKYMRKTGMWKNRQESTGNFWKLSVKFYT